VLAIRQQGDADPIVLVHGSGTSGAIWQRALPLLAHGRRAVAPDLPGYGGSAPAGPGFDLEAVAGHLAEGLEDAGVPEPYDLVGHSMGGAVAMLVAARQPRRIRRLVLVAPAGLAALPRPAAYLLGAAAAPYAFARRRLATPLAGNGMVRRLALAGIARDGARVPSDHTRAALASSAGATRIGAGLASAAAADLRAELGRLPAAPGLVWGEHDPVVPRSRIDVVLAEWPDAPVRLVPDCAHAPMLERPREFCTALDDVLARLPA
jgi:pimeloyl-ACP methyl ester carboxylesterase